MFKRRLMIFLVFFGSQGMAFLSPPMVAAQNTSTLTSVSTTTTSSLALDGFGCPACVGLSQSGPFPDTSTPVFRGDLVQDLLPASIAKGLPIDNQFGVGVPSGSSSFPIIQSRSFSSTLFSDVADSFESTPVSGGTDNLITLNINQNTLGGSFSGANGEFAILFSISSMTDPDGNLVGVASGTFTQTVDGVTTNGITAFDMDNGFSGTNLHP